MAVISTLDPLANPTVRIFPVRPNWADKVRISYDFLTDIITSGDGKEQRRAVRRNPRKTMNFSAIFHRESKLSFAAFMDTWQPGQTILPEWPMQVTLGEPMAAEAEQCSYMGGVRPDWLVVGTLAILVNGPVMETREVVSVSDSTIRFAEISTTEWPAGTKLYRRLSGRLETSPTSRLLTNDVVTFPVAFEVDPGSETYLDTEPGELVGFREVFMRKPNYERPVSVDHVYPRNVIDYGYGKIGSFLPYDFPARVTKGDFIGRDHDDVRSAIEFFIRCRGRAREFLGPTWQNDVPYYAIAGGGFAILIKGKLFGQLYADSSVFRRILIRLADGTYVHTRVDFIESLPDTDSSVMWLVEQLPIADLSPSTVIGISWELVTRFATDRLDIDWLTDSKAQFSMTTQSLENFEL